MKYHISGWEDSFVKKWQICGTESVVLQQNSSTSKHLDYGKCHKPVEKGWGEMERKLDIYKKKPEVNTLL